MNNLAKFPMDENKEEQNEPIITEVDETTEAEPSETTEPQQEEKLESIADFARRRLTEMKDNGVNLTIKAIRAQKCKEIQDEAQKKFGSCSYQAVSSQVNAVLKTKPKTEEVQSGGHSIIKKTVVAFDRPKKKTTETEQQNTEEKELSAKDKFAILAKMEEEGQSAEEMIIDFTLSDLSDFIGMTGFPKPKRKKIAQLAKRIAYYNVIQRESGHPEKVISISDTLMKYMLYAGIASTFLQPIVGKFFTNSKKDKTETDKPIVEVPKPQE